MQIGHRRTRRVATLLALGITGCESVGGPDPDVVSNITLSSPTREVAVGGTLQIAATVLNSSGAVMPNPEVSWSSSNEGVASVSPSGMVTGVAPGAADISAASGGRSAFVRIQVLPPACDAAPRRGTISLGTTQPGTLTSGDCILYGGPYAHGWRFSLAATTPVSIDLVSAAFDAVVLITTEQMEVVGFDDDGGDGTNARLLQRLPAGDYVVWATTYSPGETGAYTLTMSTFVTASCDDPLGTVQPGTTVEGALAPSDCALPDGRAADPWRLTFETETTVQIDLVSYEFDAFLFVTNSAGAEVVSDDDGGEDVDARAVHTFAPGEYTVWATSYAPGESGAYQLSVQTSSGATSSAGYGSVGAKAPARERGRALPSWMSRAPIR